MSETLDRVNMERPADILMAPGFSDMTKISYAFGALESDPIVGITKSTECLKLMTDLDRRLKSSDTAVAQIVNLPEGFIRKNKGDGLSIYISDDLRAVAIGVKAIRALRINSGGKPGEEYANLKLHSDQKYYNFTDYNPNYSTTLDTFVTHAGTDIATSDYSAVFLGHSKPLAIVRKIAAAGIGLEHSATSTDQSRPNVINAFNTIFHNPEIAKTILNNYRTPGVQVKESGSDLDISFRLANPQLLKYAVKAFEINMAEFNEQIDDENSHELLVRIYDSPLATA